MGLQKAPTAIGHEAAQAAGHSAGQMAQGGEGPAMWKKLLAGGLGGMQQGQQDQQQMAPPPPLQTPMQPVQKPDYSNYFMPYKAPFKTFK